MEEDKYNVYIGSLLKDTQGYYGNLRLECGRRICNLRALIQKEEEDYKKLSAKLCEVENAHNHYKSKDAEAKLEKV